MDPVETSRSASGQASAPTNPPEHNAGRASLEHMVFKGTARRSARQIAEEIESVGGMLECLYRSRADGILRQDAMLTMC